MGRPRDLFAWEQVTPLGDNRWKCKHCGVDYSGAASRIRDHLSGQGNGIAPCPDATEPLRNEAALKKINQNKRVRLQDPSLASSSIDPNKRVGLQDASIVSSSNDAETIARKAVEEHVAAAFLKFLYCNNVPSVANDLVKDPLYMEYVERSSKLGFPPSLVWGDSRFIRRSVSKIQGEVDEYIHHVKESWKTTGCTVMLFNLQLSPNPEDVTTAFYCPKGIFFAQGDCSTLYNFNMLHHCIPKESDNPEEDECVGVDHICELAKIRTLKKGVLIPWCIQNQIHAQILCICICHPAYWAHNLISIAEKIHKFLCSCHKIQSWYHRLLKRKRSSFKLSATSHSSNANRLAIFMSILSIRFHLSDATFLPRIFPMEIVDEFKFEWDEEIMPSIEESNFWSEGHQLELILKSVMKIGDVMDTFVPTAGYLGMALDEVDRTVQRYCRGKALRFWEELRSRIERSYGDGDEDLEDGDEDSEDGDEDSFRIVNNLNPVYYLQQLQNDSKVRQNVETLFLDLVVDGVPPEEVHRYTDEFIKVSADYELEQHHPVVVWEKYGKSLPNLQRVAIRELSRPLSCMCKQVKKHLYQLEGAEDYILKLNVRMMQHFKLLGDDIYEPLNLYPLMHSAMEELEHL